MIYTVSVSFKKINHFTITWSYIIVASNEQPMNIVYLENIFPSFVPNV